MIIGSLAPAGRGAHPVCFALVMATGIVPAALHQAGLCRQSAALLAAAAASLVILVAVSCSRQLTSPHPAQ
jgi:hypothetical protein